MKLSPKDLPILFVSLARRARPYALLIFFLFVAMVYGFTVLRINTLSSAQPSDDAVSAQLKTTAQPRIDQTVVKQIEHLQDNSVSAQALFDQARQNPFQD